MMIQVFLTVLLLAVAAMIALQRLTSRLVRILSLAVIGVGIGFVWNPETTNRIAETLGVGRGADLILYLWVVITLALIALLYLQVVKLGRRLTLLARSQALARPERPPAAAADRAEDG